MIKTELKRGELVVFDDCRKDPTKAVASYEILDRDWILNTAKLRACNVLKKDGSEIIITVDVADIVLLEKRVAKWTDNPLHIKWYKRLWQFVTFGCYQAPRAPY